MRDDELIDHIMARTKRDPNTGCDEYQLADSGRGYCQLWLSDRAPHVHRALYEAHHGPQPGLDIDHLCRNRRCVRLDHLEAVTRQENIRRRDAAGTTARGTRHGAAKLTDDDVMLIRLMYSTGDYSQRVLAREFGVHQTLISQIVRGRVWTHLPVVPPMDADIEEVAA